MKIFLISKEFLTIFLPYGHNLTGNIGGNRTGKNSNQTVINFTHDLVGLLENVENYGGSNFNFVNI